MASVLETARAKHEHLERLERQAVRELERKPVNERGRLGQLHRVSNIIDRLLTTSDNLVKMYEDKDGSRKEQISALTTMEEAEVFKRFDVRFREILENHNSKRLVSETDDQLLPTEKPDLEFSEEEASGWILDLRMLWNEFCISTFGSPMEYSEYVGTFSQTEKIQPRLKFTRQYTDYLEHILKYLLSFLHRTRPFHDLQKIFAKLESDFEEKWANREVLGWENKGIEKESVLQESEVNLDHYSTAVELEDLGLEKLKEALTIHGLKCGGTLKHRAERLFLLKDTPLDQMDHQHFAKGSIRSIKDDYKREKAFAEVKIRCLCEILDEVIERTKENAVKKLTLNYEEMEAEQELPLGWDGKPIPYWLYKLRGGLGQEFKCEICGNRSYWGQRAYERHFMERRHDDGMRYLGIPNTKNFNGITSIEEAKALLEKIQEGKS